jgi:hypothetical protein
MGMRLLMAAASAAFIAGCAQSGPPTPTASAQQQAVVPSATATAIPAVVSGAVYWNHHPQAGVTVEISQFPYSLGGRPVLASGTTSASGTFAIPYSGTSTSIGAFFPAHGPYLEGIRPATLARGSDLREVFVTDPIELVRAVTGLSVHDGDAYSPGPLTITWDPVPEATAYCVAVYSASTVGRAPTCTGLTHPPGDLVTTNRYTTEPLAPEKYAITIAAITDVVIAALPPTGISFRVVP